MKLQKMWAMRGGTMLEDRRKRYEAYHPKTVVYAN
jgi:hypothetical protein